MRSINWRRYIRRLRRLTGNTPGRTADPAKVRLRPRFETLEDRTVPSVSAALNHGALTITDHDSSGHAIAIVQEASASSYAVSVDGNALAGSPFVGVTAINLKANADNDSIAFDGSTTPTSALAGSISVTGTGNLQISVNDAFNVAGSFSVMDQTPTSALAVSVTNANASFGSMSITGGGGGTQVDLAGGMIIGNLAIASGVSPAVAKKFASTGRRPGDPWGQHRRYTWW